MVFKNSINFKRDGDRDSRFCIEKNRKRWSPEDFAHRDRDKRSNLLKQLSEGNERPQNQKFQEHKSDERNDNHTSHLRSKIGVKSSIGSRNSRERESRNETVYRVHDENNRKKSCFSDIRSHNFRFDAISSSRSNFYRRNNLESESKKKTNKNADLSKKGKIKNSGKDKKRFNLLENDLFRYTKQEQPKQKKKETSEAEKPHSGEVVNDGMSREDVFDSMLQDSYADVENGNKRKSPDKIENCDSVPPFSKSSRLPETGGESTENTAENIFTEVSPFKNDVESDSHHDVSNRDNASSLQNIVQHTVERDSDNENVKDTVKSEIYPSDYLSISVPEESFESDDSVIILDSPLIEHHIGNNESSGFINPSLPDIVPLPDEKVNEITFVREVKPLKMERWEDWESIIRSVYPEIDVTCVQDGNKALHVSPFFKRHSARQKRYSSSSSVSEILEVKPKPVVQSKSDRSSRQEPGTSPSRNRGRSSKSPARHSTQKKHASISPNDRHKSSPFRKSRSPLERRSKSPARHSTQKERASISPNDRHKSSPFRKSRSPLERRSKSLARHNTQKERASISPNDRHKSSPFRKSRSPLERRSKSPARHSTQKERASISPNDRHKSSPFRKSRSPLERRSKSPARHSTQKERASISPNDRHKSSPFRKSRSPLERRSKSPDKSNPYPAVSNRSPGGSDSLHGQYGKSPAYRERERASKRSESRSRSRSRSVDISRRPSSSSTRSSVSSSESETVKRRYTKNSEERKKILSNF